MRARLIPLILTVLAAAPAAAQVRLVEAGIVCPEIRERAERRPAPDTEAGHVDTLAGEVEFDLPDRAVPLIRHLSFGFRVALDADRPETPLTVVVEHPPFGERQVSRESWVQWVGPGETTMNLFTFDESYEMVAGPWTFAIELDGERLVEVAFEAGVPGAAERVDAVCLSMLSV